MKSIVRSVILYSFALYVVSQLFDGLKIAGGMQTIIIGGAIFAGLSMVLKPVLQAISFPLTLVTLGLFSFVINAIILFILTKIVPKIYVHAFVTPKLSYDGFKIPAYHLNIIFAFIFISAIISLLVGFLSWVTRE